MDIAAMNSHLEASYGPTRATARPSTHELALFYGDPRDGGVEITGGGYARVTVDGDSDWEAAADGAIATVWLELPPTTDEYDSEATHWALLFDPGSGDVIDDCGPLVTPLVVTGAGPGPEVRAVVRFADSIIPDEG